MTDTIAAYLKSMPAADRPQLQALRELIHSTGTFEEAIAYGMPAFRYKGKYVCAFRGYAKHTGFYPYSGTIVMQFSKELESYKTSVGAVQLPKDKPLPKMLLRKLLKARMKEISADGRS